ncbi:MAG: GC-type dockerin domain-anchored protein [Phycisphaerales bacterium]
MSRTVVARRMAVGAGALAGMLAISGAAMGQTPIDLGNGEYLLKNDRFPVSGAVTTSQNASVQAGFAAGEIAAATFSMPAGWTTLKIRRVQIYWASTTGGNTTSQQASIRIYRSSPSVPGAFVPVFDSENDAAPDGFNPVMQEGGFNEFDFAPAQPTQDNPDQNIVISGASQFTVGLVFATPTNQQTGPSVVSDGPPTSMSGCSTGKNWIYGNLDASAEFLCSSGQIQWRNACSLCTVDILGTPITFSISGNLMIRVVVDRNIHRCTVADVAIVGGGAGFDGQLTADDVILFLSAFFAGNANIADVASLGGATTPDGELTVDDIVAFLSAFFGGCQ